jgi:hypothetical protein
MYAVSAAENGPSAYCAFPGTPAPDPQVGDELVGDIAWDIGPFQIALTNAGPPTVWTVGNLEVAGAHGSWGA